jgi:predicted transcriptional regulator
MLFELPIVIHFVMSILSIRLPADIDLGLNREAERTRRPKSELARDAIAEYLVKQARERFLTEIARAARARGNAESLELAAEAFETDNEPLEWIAATDVVREPRAKYKARRKKR